MALTGRGGRYAGETGCRLRQGGKQVRAREVACADEPDPTSAACSDRAGAPVVDAFDPGRHYLGILEEDPEVALGVLPVITSYASSALSIGNRWLISDATVELSARHQLERRIMFRFSVQRT